MKKTKEIVRLARDGVIEIIPALVLLLLVVFAWEGLHRVLEINSLLLPSPTEVLRALRDNTHRLISETGITMVEAVLGFLLGVTLAYIAGVAFVASSMIRRTLYPFAVGLKATPLIVLAPLLVAWLGEGMLSKIAMAALVAFFPVLVNVVSGMSDVDRETMDLMRALSATRRQVMQKVLIPKSLPFLVAGLRTSSSLAVVGAVIGEFTGATRGIGHLITTSSYYLDTDLVFAAILMIAIAGVVFFYVVGLLDKLVFWADSPDAS